MKETLELWKALASLERSAPAAFAELKAALQEESDSEQKKLMGANTSEALFDARGRWAVLVSLTDILDKYEQRLRTHEGS